MISPEVLRRYPIFGFLNDEQLRSLAMNSEELSYPSGVTLFKEGQPAQHLYFLMEGSIELVMTAQDEIASPPLKEFTVGTINPGEPFSISVCIEPYRLTADARTMADSRVIRIDGKALQEMCAQDKNFAFHFMHALARAAVERLNATRIQLAAAWA